MEVHEYKPVHKFRNGFDNYIDIILVRGQIIVDSQEAVENRSDQILPLKAYRDHRRVVISYTAAPQKMSSTKRKRAAIAKAPMQQELAIPPIAGSARALLLNLLQTQKTTTAALQKEHQQQHKMYMASHERMSRLLNIHAELSTVLMEQVQDEIDPEIQKITEVRTVLHTETVVRQDGGELVESHTTTHHYKQVFEIILLLLRTKFRQ